MAEYIDIAYFLSKDLISKNSRDEIYEKISITVETFIECDLITVFMLNEDTEKINCVKYYEDSEFVKKDFETMVGEGLIGSVIENGESLVSKNIKDDLSDIYYELEKQFSGMSSLLSVPIYAGSLVLGALNIYKREAYEFSEEEVKIAKFIAMLGGIFIYSLTLYENANLLYLRQKEESGKVANLLEVSKLVSSSSDIASVIDYSVKNLMNFTKTDAALVYFKDKNKNKFCYEFFDCKMTGCSIFGGNVNCYTITNFECQFIKCSAESKILYKCTDCPFLKDTPLELFKSYRMDASSAVPDSFRFFDCSCLKNLISDYPSIYYYSQDNDKEGTETFNCMFKDIKKETFIGIPIKTDKDFLGFIFLLSDKKIEYSLEALDFMSDISSVISIAAYNVQMSNYIEDEHLETINSISEAIKTRDTYTGAHGGRLIHCGALVAKELGLSENEIKNVRYAAVLHDVGKIGIKDYILNKREKLTDEEYAEIKRHPEIGYNMLKKIKFLSHIANDVLHHQERYDGKGYPYGIAGDDIPVASRIIAIIDAFDAMTTDRPYRRALPVKVALDELEKYSGTQFDPKVVDAFLKVLKGLEPLEPLAYDEP